MTDNTTPAATAETLPYKNPDLLAGERIADLLSRMTLEEKVGQMMQLDARGGDLEDLIVNKHVGSSERKLWENILVQTASVARPV